jgi:hypothetical protein
MPVLTPEEARELACDKDDAFPDSHPRVATDDINSDTPSFKFEGEYYLRPGKHTDEILREYGFSEQERSMLVQDQAIETA